VRCLLLALVAVVASAQTSTGYITATFTWQDFRLGNLQLYSAEVCNVAPVGTPVATVQAYRDVWPKASARNLSLQTPTAILEAERSLESTNYPKIILWGVAGGCAIMSAVTNGGVVSLDPKKGAGKVVAYSTSACAIGLPIAAERLASKPGTDQKPVPEGEMLRPIFMLAPGDCAQGLVYAAMPFNLKVVP